MASNRSRSSGGAGAGQERAPDGGDAFDAFKYYSDDTRRMSKILLKEVNTPDRQTAAADGNGTNLPKSAVAHQQEDRRESCRQTGDFAQERSDTAEQAAKRLRRNDSRSIKRGERKTRLSFECHPSGNVGSSVGSEIGQVHLGRRQRVYYTKERSCSIIASCIENRIWHTPIFFRCLHARLVFVL